MFIKFVGSMKCHQRDKPSPNNINKRRTEEKISELSDAKINASPVWLS